MAKDVVQKIIQRAKKEESFLRELLSDPDKILKIYNLTEQERDFFRNADRKTLEGLSDKCFDLADKKKS